MPSRTRSSMPCRARLCPAKATSPRDGSTPMMAFSSVLLPAPFGPRMVTMLACGTASDTPDTAGTLS